MNAIFKPWVWWPIVEGGVFHLIPPEPGPKATTLCYRPLPARRVEQLTFKVGGPSGQKCDRCLARADGVAA